MDISLVLFVLILNYLIFSFLKSLNGLKKIFTYIVLFFVGTIMLTKFYNFLSIDGMPDGFGFFILLNFSWGIFWLFFVKKIINRKINVFDKLESDDSLPAFTYLKVITILITVFQIFLVLSKTIYIFQS